MRLKQTSLFPEPDCCNKRSLQADDIVKIMDVYYAVLGKQRLQFGDPDVILLRELLTRFNLNIHELEYGLECMSFVDMDYYDPNSPETDFSSHYSPWEHKHPRPERVRGLWIIWDASMKREMAEARID